MGLLSCVHSISAHMCSLMIALGRPRTILKNTRKKGLQICGESHNSQSKIHAIKTLPYISSVFDTLPSVVNPEAIC